MKLTDRENYSYILRRPKLNTQETDTSGEPRSKSVHIRQMSRPPLLPKYPKSRSSKRNSSAIEAQSKLSATEDEQAFPIIKTDLRETAAFTAKRVMYMSPNFLSNQLNSSYRLTTTNPPSSSSNRKRPASTAMRQSRHSRDGNASLMVEFNPGVDNMQVQAGGLQIKRKANTSHGARRKRSSSPSSSHDII